MEIHPPFEIGSRLLPMLKVGDGQLSLEFVGCDRGRMVYKWYADIPAGEFSGADLRSGIQGCSTQEMFGTLLAFLGAASESYSYQMRTGRQSENADLFPPEVVEWAYQNDDIISILEIDIKESETVLLEE